MQGLSTQSCETFIVLDVFKSKDKSLQNLSLLTIALFCGLPHVGEVEEVENSSRPEVR